jgi:hypothetical protein
MLLSWLLLWTQVLELPLPEQLLNPCRLVLWRLGLYLDLCYHRF